MQNYYEGLGKRPIDLMMKAVNQGLWKRTSI